MIYGTDGDKFEFTYVEGIIEGTAIYFAASGASEERTYVSGIPHGPATLFLTNGDTEERTYENGNLHGIATFASHNGDREERCYVSGKLDGTAKYYYSSGAIGKKYSHGQKLDPECECSKWTKSTKCAPNGQYLTKKEKIDKNTLTVNNLIRNVNFQNGQIRQKGKKRQKYSHGQ